MPVGPAVCDDGGVAEAPEARRSRRSREELRALLVTAGRSLLEEEGLAVGAGDLTFKRVFGHVEATTGVRLTNASVIRRVWENQEDFQADVLVAIASTADSSGELDRTAAVMAPLLDGFDLSSPETRMGALCELARVGGEVGMRARVETRDWSLWMGVWVLALTTGLPGPRARVREALAQGLATTTDVWEQLFAGIAAHLGIRVRVPLTLRQFTVAVSALVEGSALRQGGDPELQLVERPTGSGGAPQEWTLFGVCMEALALRFFEVDPDWAAPAAG
jgi:hypothetical protein